MSTRISTTYNQEEIVEQIFLDRIENKVKLLQGLLSKFLRMKLEIKAIKKSIEKEVIEKKEEIYFSLHLNSEDKSLEILKPEIKKRIKEEGQEEKVLKLDKIITIYNDLIEEYEEEIPDLK
jgi:hypothetical protein